MLRDKNKKMTEAVLFSFSKLYNISGALIDGITIAKLKFLTQYNRQIPTHNDLNVSEYGIRAGELVPPRPVSEFKGSFGSRISESRIKNISYMVDSSNASFGGCIGSNVAPTLLIALDAKNDQPYGNKLDPQLIEKLKSIKNSNLMIILLLITNRVGGINPQLSNDGRGGGIVKRLESVSDERGRLIEIHYPEINLEEYSVVIDKIIFLNSSVLTYPKASFESIENVEGLLLLDRALSLPSLHSPISAD